MTSSQNKKRQKKDKREKKRMSSGILMFRQEKKKKRKQCLSTEKIEPEYTREDALAKWVRITPVISLSVNNNSAFSFRVFSQWTHQMQQRT